MGGLEWKYTFSFLRALNLRRHSTVSCRCIMEATVDLCWTVKKIKLWPLKLCKVKFVQFQDAKRLFDFLLYFLRKACTHKAKIVNESIHLVITKFIVSAFKNYQTSDYSVLLWAWFSIYIRAQGIVQYPKMIWYGHPLSNQANSLQTPVAKLHKTSQKWCQ